MRKDSKRAVAILALAAVLLFAGGYWAWTRSSPLETFLSDPKGKDLKGLNKQYQVFIGQWAERPIAGLEPSLFVIWNPSRGQTVGEAVVIRGAIPDTKAILETARRVNGRNLIGFFQHDVNLAVLPTGFTGTVYLVERAGSPAEFLMGREVGGFSMVDGKIYGKFHGAISW